MYFTNFIVIWQKANLLETKESHIHAQKNWQKPALLHLQNT